MEGVDHHRWSITRLAGRQNAKTVITCTYTPWLISLILICQMHSISKHLDLPTWRTAALTGNHRLWSAIQYCNDVPITIQAAASLPWTMSNRPSPYLKALMLKVEPWVRQMVQNGSSLTSRFHCSQRRSNLLACMIQLGLWCSLGLSVSLPQIHLIMWWLTWFLHKCCR